MRAVVINVVYDGPPRAGKTTSVRALARGLGREVYTPEERDGRTVYFDALEHVGGRFEGAPIHCQVVSVPGQRRWTRRRGHFLDRADVVVFVGDTSAEGWPETLDRLRELRAQLDARAGAPVGLVLQANKRDLEDAVSLDEIRSSMDFSRTAIIESCAEDGTGIRETFVFAVRLALDRVRDEIERGAVSSTRWTVTPVGPELVEHLRDFDDAPGAALDAGWWDAEAPAEPTEETRVEPAAPRTSSVIRPPTADAPSGLVWPPIEGRILLHEAAPPPGVDILRTREGDLAIQLGGDWRVHSRSAAQFKELEDGRAALLAWARDHAAAQAVVSRRRCIVLVEGGDHIWRLWQVVERQPSLGDLVETGDLEADAANRMLEDISRATAEFRISCTLETVGLEAGRPVFLGLMP